METAKVDIRKLQLLNDRISQVAEALNQVRLSVHGLSHTGQFTQGQQPGVFGQNPYLTPQQNPSIGLPYQQQIPQGLGVYPQMQGFPTQGFPAQGFPTQGLSHTSAQPFGSPPSPQSIGWNPYASYGQLGQDEAMRIWSDPYVAQRVQQTFPFAYSPYALPPVVSI